MSSKELPQLPCPAVILSPGMCLLPLLSYAVEQAYEKDSRPTGRVQETMVEQLLCRSKRHVDDQFSKKARRVECTLTLVGALQEPFVNRADRLDRDGTEVIRPE